MPQLSALIQNAGGKTTPWMALIIEDLHALRAREGWKLGDPPEFSADPTPWNRIWMEFSKAWQTMVYTACGRDFLAYSFGETVTAESTEQHCETAFASEAELHKHLQRGGRQKGIGKAFHGDTLPQCQTGRSLSFLVCTKIFLFGGGVSSVAIACFVFFFCCDVDEISARSLLDRLRLNRHQKLNSKLTLCVIVVSLFYFQQGIPCKVSHQLLRITCVHLVHSSRRSERFWWSR